MVRYALPVQQTPSQRALSVSHVLPTWCRLLLRRSAKAFLDTLGRQRMHVQQVRTPLHTTAAVALCVGLARTLLWLRRLPRLFVRHVELVRIRLHWVRTTLCCVLRVLRKPINRSLVRLHLQRACRVLPIHIVRMARR